MHPISASSLCHADFITSQMNLPIMRNSSLGKAIDAQLAVELPAALKSNEIKVTLQPKVNLDNFEIYGYEVLLRWLHPKLGIIPADRWIMVAETNGLMPQLTLWLVEEVALLSKTINHTSSFAVNISPGCLTPEFADVLLSLYQENAIPYRAIEIEITESTEIEDYRELSKTIDLLRSKGIKVGLDDFGTGYASMRTLMELNVDEIKIDKSIVQSPKPSAQAILKSLVSLAQDMGLSVVFEGIETQKHLNIAKSLGAHKGQGYLFGRPQEVPQSLLQNLHLEINEASVHKGSINTDKNRITHNQNSTTSLEWAS